MDDLISRKAAIVEIDEYLQGLDSCISEPDLKLDGYKNGLQVAIQELKALPAVDAVPVVHAEWIEQPDRVRHYHCSNCCMVWGIIAKAMKYCPGCGAKMMNSLWDLEDAT